MTTKDLSRVAHTQPQIAASLLALIKRMVEESRGSSEIDRCELDSNFVNDLGIDSLSRLELLRRIEHHFGVRLPEQVVMTADTPRGLIDALAEASQHPKFRAPLPEERPAPQISRQIDPPWQAQTLLEVLDWHAAHQGDAVHAYLLGDHEEVEEFTYERLRSHSLTVAGGLMARGIEKGDKVAIMLPTGSQFLASFFGVLMAGGVPVPLYPPASYARIEEHVKRQVAILKNCNAKSLLTVAEAKKLGMILRAALPGLESVLTVSELLKGARASRAVECTRDDVAFLQYTSGSTGDPKGVVLTHANLISNVAAISRALQVRAGDVCVSWLPLYHDMGLIGAWLGSLFNGCPLVLMSPLYFLARPERWLKAIHRYRGTISAAPNFAYQLCATRLAEEHLSSLDLSSWRVALSGAEAVSPSTIDSFCARFAGCNFDRRAIMPVYGLAENSLAVTIPPLGRGCLVDRIDRKIFQGSGHAQPAAQGLAEISFVSCGVNLAEHEVRIVDAGGYEAPEREQGRIQFRGPSATTGYFEQPAANRKLLEGGWLNSGDYGYMAGGELYVTGRQKDIIIRAGRNIYPQEIEEAVSQLPGVRAGGVAAFPASDPKLGSERMVILAETRERKPEARDVLRQKIARTVSELCDIPPDDIVLAPPRSVPKTSSGKVRRASARSLYEQGKLGQRRDYRWQLLRLAVTSAPGILRGLSHNTARFFYALRFWFSGIVIFLSFLPIVLALPKKVARRAAKLACRMMLTCWGTRVEAEGLSSLSDPELRVAVCNHSSYLDAFVLMAYLPDRFVFVTKKELAAQPVAAALLRKLDALFVERGDAQQSAEDMREIEAHVSSGGSALFFPEATFQRAPGLMPFRLGAFLVASKANQAVVPILLTGTRNMLRSDQWFPRRTRLKLSILEALRAREEGWGGAVKLRDEVRQSMLGLLKEPDLGHLPLASFDLKEPAKSE